MTAPWIELYTLSNDSYALGEVIAQSPQWLALASYSTEARLYEVIIVKRYMIRKIVSQSGSLDFFDYYRQQISQSLHPSLQGLMDELRVSVQRSFLDWLIFLKEGQIPVTLLTKRKQEDGIYTGRLVALREGHVTLQVMDERSEDLPRLHLPLSQVGIISVNEKDQYLFDYLTRS